MLRKKLIERFPYNQNNHSSKYLCIIENSGGVFCFVKGKFVNINETGLNNPKSGVEEQTRSTSRLI